HDRVCRGRPGRRPSRFPRVAGHLDVHVDDSVAGGQLLLCPHRRPVFGSPCLDGEPHAHSRTRSTAEEAGPLVTSKRTGTRSASSRTWVTMPTMRPPAPRFSMADATTSSV